ncbi:MAG: DUF4040 domain-containing protein [Clostridia bacterium]|nr:DUF4040 domain-containing protein [Clostridia bacterium]
MIVRILLVILIILAILVVKEKNNLHLIMYFSIFSFTAASVYFLNYALDIALAEVAVGCAFVPLIYLITVSKQNVFTVLIDKEFLHGEDYQDNDLYKKLVFLLEDFCSYYTLELKVVTKRVRYYPTVQGIFRPGNIDLIVSLDEENNHLVITGNKSNIMIPRLDKMTRKYKNIDLIEVDEYEGLDE